MKLATAVILSVAAFPALVSAHQNHARQHHARQQGTEVLAASSASTSASTQAASAAASTSSSGAVSASTSASTTSYSVTGIGPSVSLLSTNPTAVPLSSIVAGAPSQATHSLASTPVAGAQPTLVAGAPPLPNLALINPANYPALDKPPPTDSPQVQQWIQEVANSGVTIPNITPTVAGGCPANLQAVADTSRCWWTCGGCTRDTDITTCPDKLTWGLTYDDGPSPYTPDLLAYLDQNNLKSTFFTIGSRAISLPAVLQTEYIGGHQIGVHTWSHPSLTTLTNEEIIAELGWSKKVIYDILGVTPNTMRPPYGDIDDRVRAICTAMGLTPVIWTRISAEATFDTNDFSIAGGITTVGQVLLNWDNILGNATTIDTGFIVLEHDLFQQSVDVAVGYILPDALAHQPAFRIEPVVTCLNKPLSDAYIETNDNSTNPPPISASGVVTLSSGAPGSAQATGASGAKSNAAAGTAADLNLFSTVGTAIAGLMAGAGALLF